MNTHSLFLAGCELRALASGALWWPERSLLCVSDLHFGKALRPARSGGVSLPPYETRDTLERLSDDLEATDARVVICLGDSFDTAEDADLMEDGDRLWLTQMQAGRFWVWIAGNHDPEPVNLGGTHMRELPLHPITFRHIADAEETGEVSGHFHPKAVVRTRARTISRPAFLADSNRIILPAYGTYTGGLRSEDSAFSHLMRPEAVAVLTGKTPRAFPMPRETIPEPIRFESRGGPLDRDNLARRAR